ncbi:hypothetical protein E4U11_003969 [Claviceps purpurea]|nr:hypothetical protein E4U11_003969 [Claviceps purpurea]KAG6253460.1 hypothetical protein E4U49_007497 [Claviceps purpurea]
MAKKLPSALINPSLCAGAKVILTDNFWTAKGPVNSAIGTVADTVWKDGTASHYASDARKQAPTIVLVHFGSYTGPIATKLLGDLKLDTHISQHFGADDVTSLSYDLLQLRMWLSCFASGFHLDEIPQQKAQQRDPYSTPPITIKRLNRTILMAAGFVGMNSPYLCYRRSSADSIIEERGICRHRFP